MPAEYPRSWQQIVDSADQASAVRQHLAVLAESDACRLLLDDLMKVFIEARIDADDDDARLELIFRSQYDEDCMVICDAPYLGDVSTVPASVGELLRTHNGIAWESIGGGWYGYSGMDEDGHFMGAGGWEWDALLDARDRNEPFLAAVAEAGLKPRDVRGALDFGQNWLIWHPAQTNAVGEPRLYFVSHGDCVAIPVTSADTLRFGPLLLRVMASYIIDAEVLAEAYD